MSNLKMYREKVRISQAALAEIIGCILSALTIKILTFASQQDPAQWFQRWRGGANGNK
ncbi:hypothetical protein [Cronobacter dublinensis]|uniref:hypothetical protein n=1 Tax=Cronobacter dublinensis TaxID=413497 RepID=UPI001319EFAE|nr:hypothetical protein [Cronobacter dublinensis]